MQNHIDKQAVKELVHSLQAKRINRFTQKQGEAKGEGPGKGTDIWELLVRWKDLNRLKYSPGHLRKFNPVKKWVDLYAPTFVLEDLDEIWVQKYKNWLLENSSLRDGGMRIHFIFFRIMLKFARLPYEWLENDFTENTQGADLTYDEVARIFQYPYVSSKLREAADIYVFLCFVGLRYSDYLRLDKVERVMTPKGEVLVILDMRQQKTKQEVTIPLNETARYIWEKYAGHLPKPTNQTYNHRLKEMAKEAGLTRVMKHTTVRGNTYTTVERPLHELVSAHTSRHTCASLLLQVTGNKEMSQLTLGQTNRVSTDIYARFKQMQEIDDSGVAWGHYRSIIPENARTLTLDAATSQLILPQ